MYKEIEGDLISLALEGKFDVIAHGCNCFCTMGAGIAVIMAKRFHCNSFPLEQRQYKGDINKLGSIDFRQMGKLTVVNAYTQYNYGANHKDGDKKPVDYEAIALCMRKINHIFKGKHVGLPYVIGAGLAGGDPGMIIEIIQKELQDCNVTMVKLPNKL